MSQIDRGMLFVRLTVLREKGNATSGHKLWECRCICGVIKVCTSSDLRSGGTKSCGCLKRETSKKNKGKKIHGHTSRKGKSRTYRSWQHMIDRCCNPKSDHWKFYGAKGVRVCKRWRSFPAFLSDMGERPVNTMLGRRGDVGDYKPDNCLWQTLAEDLQTRKEKRERNRQRT